MTVDKQGPADLRAQARNKSRRCDDLDHCTKLCFTFSGDALPQGMAHRHIQAGKQVNHHSALLVLSHLWL